MLVKTYYIYYTKAGKIISYEIIRSRPDHMLAQLATTSHLLISFNDETGVVTFSLD